MVSGHICLANGSISFVRTRRIPLVSSLAAAISEIALDAADHRLDCEHYPHLRHVALAHTWASVGIASCLGHAGGIRMRGNRCCSCLVPWKRAWACWCSLRLKSIVSFSEILGNVY